MPLSWTARAAIGRAVLAAATAALAAGCTQSFDGPYPCTVGFASCSTPDQCETDVTSDPQNCSMCGTACDQGARCENGSCTTSPPTLSTGVVLGPIAINSDDVFFWSSANPMIEDVPKAGGTPVTAVAPSQQGELTDMPFAVDDSRIYYLAQNFTGTGGWVVAASPTNAADASASPPSVVGTFPTTSTVGTLSSMVIFQATIFMSWNVNGTFQVGSVPTGGGAVSVLASFGNSNGGVAVDANGIYAVVTQPNGPCEIDRAPIAGGTGATIAPDANGCPNAIATDGSDVYWATSGSVTIGNNNANACVLQVSRVPETGGAVTTLATLVTSEQPLQIAADPSYVYVATDESLWQFPTSDGGAPLRLAGNLGATSATNGASGCGNSGGTGATIALAIDDTSAYVVVPTNPGSSGGVLLKIAK
jgi:hypothetical protein